ncbi:MAG: hypothetical protein ACR2PM_09265 [Hyphomicrobiales bacterium]
MTEDRSIAGHVAELAELILRDGMSDAFRLEAGKAAATLEPDDLDDLRHLLHHPPPEPEMFDTATHGLGGWLSACQFAAFELVYTIGEPALPFLRKIAWGEYDWTQGNAIEIMIRLAARGVATDAIVEEVKRNFPDIRYEAQLYTLEPLLPLLDADDRLKAVIGRLDHCVAFADIHKELTARG